MKLHQLRAAVAVAEHGSLRAAARSLGTAQPTLTRSVSELERELGAPLFERRSHGMRTTALGRAFVLRAVAILNDVRRAQEEFEQLRGGTGGRVTIGLSIAAHFSLLPKTLRPFRRKFPEIRLHIIEGFYPTLEHALQDGSVDFYIGPDPGLRLPTLLRKETVLTGRRAVLCRIGHPLIGAKSLHDLVGAEWISTSITPKAEKELGDLFKRHGLPEPKLALRSQSALTLLTVPRELRHARHGAAAMDGIGADQPVPDHNSGPRGTGRTAFDRDHAIRRAARAGGGLFPEPVPPCRRRPAAAEAAR